MKAEYLEACKSFKGYSPSFLSDLGLKLIDCQWHISFMVSFLNYADVCLKCVLPLIFLGFSFLNGNCKIC